MDLVALILIRQSGFTLFPPTIFDKMPAASEHFNPISLTFQVKSLHRQKKFRDRLRYPCCNNAGSRNLSIDVFDISVKDNFFSGIGYIRGLAGFE